MKTNRYLTGLFSVLVCTHTSFAADIGLSSVLSQQGVQAMGLAVKSAAGEVLVSAEDSAVVQTGLTAILDEAAATGDPKAVQYAIIAVILTVGPDRQELSLAAIAASRVSSLFPEIAAQTAQQALLLLSADTDESGGAGQEKTGWQDGGHNPFAWNTLHGEDDKDLPATRI